MHGLSPLPLSLVLNPQEIHVICSFAWFLLGNAGFLPHTALGVSKLLSLALESESSLATKVLTDIITQIITII